MLVFWALVITFVYFAFRGTTSSGFSLRGPGAAEILRRRLADGEISPDEYRDRLATIEGTGKPKDGT